MKKTLLLLATLSSVLFFKLDAQNIAVFWDSDYVPIGSSCLDEASNLEATILDLGYTISTYITDIDNFTTDLPGIDILVIPETELGKFNLDLTAANRVAINGFVNNGGRLIHLGGSAFGTSSNSVDNLNTIFGFTLSESGVKVSESTSILPDQTAGTCFEGGAVTLLNNSGTHLIIPTLPSGAKCFYKDSNNETSVAFIPFGIGGIYYLGWDWFEGGPTCPARDTDWDAILNCAILDVLPVAELKPLPLMKKPYLLLLGIVVFTIGFMGIRKI